MYKSKSKAESFTMQLASEFLQNGNFEAMDSPMGISTVESVLPATTDISFPHFDAYGFSGLSVQSVGYSAGAEEEVVHVYVTSGSKSDLSNISGEKDGVKVQITNLGRLTIRPEAASVTKARGNFYERNGRIACGSSCAPAGENYSGTFGALVNRDGVMMALSNNHVFAACNHIPVGQPILSPSAIDAQPSIPAPRQLCQHSQIIELRSGTPELVPLVHSDAAIATVPDKAIVSSWQGDNSGYDTPTGTIEPISGLRVKKVGRTTGLTFGTVEALIPAPMLLPYKLRYFTAHVWFTDVWTIKADKDKQFALPGDSGSLVISEDGKDSVGLLFAATNKGDYGFIAPIETVLHNLNLTLIGNHGI